MSLADFEPERVTIDYKGKPLVSVRGLSLSDVGVLVRTNGEFIQSLFTQWRSEGALAINEELINRLVTEAPEVASVIIALGCDERESMTKVYTLPLPLQVRILGEIARLTFEDSGGPKGFVDLLGRLTGTNSPSQGSAALN